VLQQQRRRRRDSLVRGLGEYMLADVDRGDRRGVPGVVLHHLHRRTGGAGEADRAVAYVVQPDRRQIQVAGELLEAAGQPVRPKPPPIQAGEQLIVRSGRPSVLAFDRGPPVFPEHLDRVLIQGEGALAGGRLRRPDPLLPSHDRDLFADRQFTADEVEVGPAHADEFAPADRPQPGQPPQRELAVILNTF